MKGLPTWIRAVIISIVVMLVLSIGISLNSSPAQAASLFYCGGNSRDYNNGCYGMAIWAGDVIGASTRMSLVTIQSGSSSLVIANSVYLKDNQSSGCTAAPYCFADAGYDADNSLFNLSCPSSTGQGSSKLYQYYYFEFDDGHDYDYNFKIPASNAAIPQQECYQRTTVNIQVHSGNTIEATWNPDSGVYVDPQSANPLYLNFNAHAIQIGQSIVGSGPAYSQNTSWVSNHFYQPSCNACPQTNPGYVVQSYPTQPLSANWQSTPVPGNDGGDFRANT